MLFGPEPSLAYRFSHKRRRARGFTLVEAMVAMSITAIAASALLLGVASALQATDEAVQQTVAAGLARQLMDEIAGTRYVDTGAIPRSGTREFFDDFGDFDGFSSRPPVDRWGIPLGRDDGNGRTRHPNFDIPSGVLDNWWQEVAVYYVDPDFPAVPVASVPMPEYRAVEVRIVLAGPDGQRRVLAELHRIVAYVPPL